ncbi:MAG: hypothetical protein HZB62_10955 [Nitrospirae bacterium]|nr:hypothetical protein [Nitrospirota bacterium]
MEKKKKKVPTDINQIASYICDVTTNESKPTDVIECKPEKNPAAVALGRLGGLKGGKARAESLTAKKRKEIAKKAAQARWKK